MATKKSRPRKTWRFSTIVWTYLTLISGGGLGAYFNPDWPIIGPLLQSLREHSDTEAAGALTEQLRDVLVQRKRLETPSGPTEFRNSAADQRVLAQRPADRLLIATFNIQVFGKSKLAKQDVMKVIVETLRQFDIVAIQEVRAKEDDILPRLIDAINANGSRYHFLVGPRLGRTVSTEQYAFVYDTNRVEYDPSSVSTFHDPTAVLHREPFMARFRPLSRSPENAFSFWLVNIHTDPDEVTTEVAALADVFQAMRVARPDEDDVILLGDLNASETQLGRLGQIPGITWVVSGAMTNTLQTKAYDNIVFDGPDTSEYTGRWGVFDLATYFGLSKENALRVSDHLPVWAEFQIWEARGQGQFAERSPRSQR